MLTKSIGHAGDIRIMANEKAIGYKGHRLQSRKGAIHRIFDTQGPEAARAAGEERGLKPSTVSSWLSTWKRTAEAGFGESEAKFDPPDPERHFIQVGPGGRIVIPVAFRNAMQVKEGDELMARLVDGELRLITPVMAVRLAQKMVRETIPGNVSLVDTLMEQRRKEYEDEFGDG
jgi:bifunctional DNA-binding transcriptional regulator/antitoxin component of YhaV-PrlF toxin-antitoxin module